MRLLPLAALLGSMALPASAATLLDQFTFTTDFGADIGTATAAGGGTVSGGRYNLGTNQGLTVSLGTTLSSWSIAFSGALDALDGYKKLIDLSGLTSDNGLYALNGFLDYYSVAGSAAATIAAGIDFTGILTYDGSITRGYVNGAQQFSFIATGAGFPHSLSSFVMFQDDATTVREASSGSLDFVQVYNGALSSDEVSHVGPNPVSAVPLPAGAPLLLAGLGGLALLRRRKA